MIGFCQFMKSGKNQGTKTALFSGHIFCCTQMIATVGLISVVLTSYSFPVRQSSWGRLLGLLVAQLVKNFPPARQEDLSFDSWVGKIRWEKG